MTKDDSPRLHFHRYEFKYLVSGEVLQNVIGELEARLERDVHSDRTGSYFVRSHYFDTDNYDCYYEKLAGLMKRYKFRLRSYSECQRYSDPLFLELKGRDDCLVYKHRLLLDSASAEKAMGRDTTALVDHMLSRGSINGTGKRFVFDVFRKRLSPSVVVDYHRSAFENRADPDFRATLDRQVLAFRAGPDGHPRGPGRQITSGFQILEIKFRYRLPKWFHRLIQEQQLRRTSFSKFAWATDLAYMREYDSHLDRVIERRTACLT